MAALAFEEAPRESIDCDACIDVWKQVKSLRALGQQLTWDTPDSERVSRMRGAIINALRVRSTSPGRAPTRSTTALRHWGFRAVAAASFASIATLVLARYQHRVHPGAVYDPVSLATIQERGPAHFQQVRRPPDEEIHVTNGKVHVAVVHLDRGQRFRIVTADATVEVRGTEFDVEAVDDRLRSVDVSRGKVEVRVFEQDTVTLTPGLHWDTQRTRPAEASPLPAPASLESIRPSADIPSSRRTHQHSELVKARVIEAPTPAHTSPIDTPSLIESPRSVKSARPAATVIEARPREGGESPAATAPTPGFSGVAGTTTAPTARKRNAQDEPGDRQERREEHLERRRELREERLQRRR
jgi:hypothetical protein